MYNEELKSKFIRQYTQSISTAKHAVTIFNTFEPHEYNWGADLCTKNTADLQPIVNDLVGFRRRSRWMTLAILKEYVKWCLGTGVPGSCDGMLYVEICDLSKMRSHMVSGPLHLQRYLNSFLEKESEETVDNIYRCFYWLAYAGLFEEEAFLITVDDVELNSLTINYKGLGFPIYREAIPAFKNAVELTGFYYKHPKYSEIIWRDRAQGNTLLRGFRDNMKPLTVRALLSSRGAAAVKDGKTDQQLSYYRVWLSGLFYRMREAECAGFPVSFADATARFMEGKEYKNPKIQFTKIAKEYYEDYQRWKMAFFI